MKTLLLILAMAMTAQAYTGTSESQAPLLLKPGTDKESPSYISTQELIEVLEACAKEIRPSNEPVTQDAVMRSPGQALREAADAADKREALALKIREMLKMLKGEK